MSNFIETFIQPGLFNGLCYGIAAIGISLPLRFLRTADFTAVGSIMVGGVVSLAITNASGSVVTGLVCGSIIAGLLGVLTAFLSLNSLLNIPLMLAGIICFTASQSLGLLMTNSGQIEIPKSVHFLLSKFYWPDIAITAAIALAIIIVGGILAASKWGCLAFAMCSNSHFVKFRHRHSQPTTYWLLFISNLLVGLCGGLISLKLRSAEAAINTEFLSLTLGAIFAGDAVVLLVARSLKRKIPEVIILETRTDTPSNHTSHWENFKLSLSEQRDDSERLWFIFLSYILASIALNNLVAAVRGKTIFDVPAAWEHVVVAVFITFGLFLSNSKRKSK